MQSKAKTAEKYLLELPEVRRIQLQAVRDVILKNLPEGYEESMSYGMIVYAVPLTRYPAGYLGNPKIPLSYVALAAQKHYVVVYLDDIHPPEGVAAESWFMQAYKASGKKMDIGKCCVRFKKLDDLPLELIGKAVARTPVDVRIKAYEKTRR